jgi:hypothetical protein
MYLLFSMTRSSPSLSAPPYAMGRSLAMGPYPTPAKRTCNFPVARVAVIPMRSRRTKVSGTAESRRPMVSGYSGC